MLQGSPITVSMPGTFSDALGGTGTFGGTFAINSFVRDENRIVASGTLTGTLVDSQGRALSVLQFQTITLPVEPATGADGCPELLRFEVGPFQIDWLGLPVSLGRVSLYIAEEPL